MEPLIDLVLVVGGGLFLYFGAEWLVRGAAGLAHAFGVKPLVVGLTVVAYGTSAPELAVSGAAIVDGSSAMVLGNIVGSCIANLGLILGITALIAPPYADGRLISREVPVLVASVAALPAMLYSGAIGTMEAALLFTGAMGFTAYTLGVSAKDTSPTAEAVLAEAPETEGDSKIKLAVFTVGGLAVLLCGGELFVDGSRGLAIWLGMSERLVGLTVVALGTSLPELAASLVAALRGHSSLAIGNVVGSNIFNIFLVLGAVGLIAPIEGSLPDLRLDMAFLVGVTLLGVLSMRGSRRVSRAEGGVFVTAYAAFIAFAIAGF